MIATSDPTVFIEEQRNGYVRYASTDGRRWEVHGTCIGIGNCMIGAIVDGIAIETLEQARALPPLDVDSPVGPGFTGCCDLTITVL